MPKLNQRGIAPLVVIIAVLLFGGVSTFVASKTVFNKPSPTSSQPLLQTDTQPKAETTSSPVKATLDCTTTRIVLSINGEVPAPTNNDNVWSTLTDEKSGKTIIYELVGSAGIGGPGTMVSVNANLTISAASIRGQGSLPLLCDGRNYLVNIYNAPFTEGIPQLINPIAQTAVSQSAPILPSPTLVPTTVPGGGTDTSGSLGGINVITYLRSDKKAYFIDFKATSFQNFATLYYNLNYDTDMPSKIRGVESTFVPASDQIYGYDGGKPYIRREMLLGTCSKMICTYDSNPRNFRLTVTATTKGGQKYTKTQTLNY